MPFDGTDFSEPTAAVTLLDRVEAIFSGWTNIGSEENFDAANGAAFLEH